MIAAGLMRAVARRPIWPLAIAGVAAAPMFLAAPVLAAPVLAGTVLAGSATSTQVTNCGGGVSAVTVRPAAGFHPLSATPAQLTANGLPLRPKGRAELAVWRKFVTGGVRAARTTCVFAPVTPSSAARSIVGDAKPGSLVGDAKPGSLVGDAQPGSLVGDAKPGSLVGDAKPGSLVGDAQPGSLVGDAKPASMVGDAQPVPSTAPRPSPGGNRATAATRAVVSGTWRVTRPRNAPAAAASSWAGIGAGRAGNPLIQAGSSAGGYFGPYLWWRMVPQRPNEQRISLDTAAGDTVYVRIQLRSGTATVTIRDENTGAGGTYRLRY
jgi:Peptidase A4 family